MSIDFSITKKQKEFIDSPAFETLFGGAAGGGKSYGQLIDAFLFALKYPKSKQLLLRRTFPDLERSLILVSLELYNRSVCKYKENKHRWIFQNGSIIEFGYCDNEKDVYRYQGAEYDVIRFDELTHFTEYQYTWLISRVRGVNGYPKAVKSSTNPGGIGHQWVKARFIDNRIPNTVYEEGKKKGKNTRMFIPSKVKDNKYLLESDPDYIDRLEMLPENERKALLDGDWDLYEGQYYPEFKKTIHVVKPFEIPNYWKRVRSLDYGLDMTACIWWAIAPDSREYAYRELHQPGLNLSNAAKKIVEMTPVNERIEYTVASPDLWNRRQETGYSGAEIMTSAGLGGLRRANNNRIAGWRALREHLTPFEDEQGIVVAPMQIFENCVNLTRCIPALQHDENNVEDVADKPHEITHAPESARYFTMSRPSPAELIRPKLPDNLPDDLREDLESDPFAFEHWMSTHRNNK